MPGSWYICNILKTPEKRDPGPRTQDSKKTQDPMRTEDPMRTKDPI